MNYEIIQMDADSWRIEDGGVRFFLLAGYDKALLIDSGMNLPNAREIAEGLTDLPLEIINTHADRDHIAGNRGFRQIMMHPKEEAHYRAGGGAGEIIPVQEGDEIDLGGRILRIIELEGHTPGSIAILDPARRVLISGDSIQQHGRIFMFGAHRNLKDYAASMARLEGRRQEFDAIWPSHAALPLSPDLIPRLKEGAERILAGQAELKEVDFREQKIHIADLGFVSFLLP